MKKLKKTIIISIILIIFASMSILLIKDNTKENKLEQKNFQSIDISPGEKIYTYNEYIYIYGKSGIKIAKQEDVLAQESFSLENPYIATSYDKLAICDVKGKVARVYSNKGNLYTVNTANSILGITINKNGYLGMILKNNENYEIEIYDNSGQNIYSTKDISYNEGVPVGISISDDNKTLAVSYIKTIGATIDSNIVFYSMEGNEVFGGYIKSNQIVGIIKFVENNSLIGVSESEIFSIKVNSNTNNEQIKEIYKKPLNNVLKDMDFIDGVGYVVCYGKPILTTKEYIEENTVIFYNSSGGEIGKYYEKDKDIINLYSHSEGVVLQENRLFTAINTSGREIWSYQATQDIKQVNFYNKNNKALIVTNDKIKIVKIDKSLLDKQIDENNTTQTTIKDDTTETTVKDNKAETTTKDKETQPTTKAEIKETTIKDKETQDKTTTETTKETNAQSTTNP